MLVTLRRESQEIESFSSYKGNMFNTVEQSDTIKRRDWFIS